MFRFAAVIGCADIMPVHGALITRKGNHLTVRCNQSREEYHLRCFNMKWVGSVQNCSAGKLQTSHPNAVLPVEPPRWTNFLYSSVLRG